MIKHDNPRLIVDMIKIFAMDKIEPNKVFTS